MKHIVPVILAVTAILAALTFAIINESHYLKGYAWAVPYLLALIVLLLVLATRIAVINSRQEREKKNDLPPPLRLENNPTFTQEFKPQQNFYFNASPSGTVAVEPDEIAISVREFMKRTHPHSAYEVDKIATALNLTKPGTRDALRKLEIEGWVRRIEADQGTLWMFYDVEM